MQRSLFVNVIHLAQMTFVGEVLVCKLNLSTLLTIGLS